MGFWGFVRKHLWPSLVGGAGALIAVWGFLGEAQSLWTAGVKPGYLQLSGFVLFLVGVVSVIYRQQQHLEDRLPATVKPSPPPVAEAVERKPPIGAEVTAEPSDAVRPEGRQYVPARFTADLAEFTRQRHTELQRQAFLAPHVGQWVRGRGTLATTTDHGASITAHVRFAEDGEPLYVEFPASWRSQLARIAPGQRLDFDAQIAEDFQKRPCLTNGALL